jgi:hypothetical protein
MMTAQIDMTSFEARRKALAKAPLVASKQAVSGGVIALRGRLRADVRKAFGKPMDYAWAGDVFPPGHRLANNPSGLIYSRAKDIVSAFEFGADIRGARAHALYIPIPGSPADKKRAPKKSLVKEMIGRFGQPREVPLKDGSGWLLLFPTRTSKTTGNKISSFYQDRKTKERRQTTVGVTWTPFFIVKRQVKLAPRLKSRQIMQQFEREWPDIFTKILARTMADA